MKKMVISGSAKLQDRVNYWLEHFKNKDYEILDYPKKIKKETYITDILITYKNFYNSLENAYVYFLMNQEHKGIKSYIESSSIAESTYAVILNLIHNKNIEIYILNIPSEEVVSYDEVKMYLDMGWIKLYK